MSDTDTKKPEDRSKFIRTYAKDVAALTNTAVAAPAVPVKTPDPEPVAKPASAWHSVTPAARPAPAVHDTRAEEEDKMAILARLREKVGKTPPSPPPTPAPLPPPTPPVFTPPPPAPMPTVAKPERIHTYKSDFADHIDDRGASAFTVLAADADTNKKQVPKAKKNGLPLIAGGIILLVLGGGGITAAFWYVAQLSRVPASPLAVPSLVFADERVKLTGTGRELMQALASAAEEPLVEGNVLITYLSESTTTPKGQVKEIPLTGGALIRALQLPAPDILLRNISSQSTVGIISAGVETRPFFIFRVTSYERTFAGMLAWEATIARDLSLLYPSRSLGPINSEATVINLGTSTPATAAPQALAAFSDAVVANHDVRVLKDTAGNTLMLYGYADKQTLVLARDEAAFAALLTRLAAQPR